MEKINGTWKKYEKTKNIGWNKGTSYDALYNDLKDSGKDWIIAKDYAECQDQLCGELLPNEGIEAGDIYVFYRHEDDKDIPEFYIKITEKEWEKEKSNYISFNDRDLKSSGIDFEYYMTIADKLREIDAEKNKEYIEELEYQNVYNNYISLLEKQDTYGENDLVFLYYMAYKEGNSRAKKLIEGRDVKADFDSFSNDNKINLFLTVRDLDFANQFVIDSKEVLSTLAEEKSLKQLNNAKEEVINDKDYIKEVLRTFFEADEDGLAIMEFIRHLPAMCQTDLDVLNFAFNNYTTLIAGSFNFWYQANPKFAEKLSDPDFAYGLVDGFSQALIDDGRSYYDSGLLYLLPDEILENIEDNVLVVSESDEEKEKLRVESLEKIQKQKVKVMNSRNGN